MNSLVVTPPTYKRATNPSPASIGYTVLPVTVLIATRDRGDSVTSTIRSITACGYPNLTLVVVDQSEDHRTAHAITAMQDVANLRYISTPTHGLSQALNLGLAFVNTDLVIVTDDDCVVPPNWIVEMIAPFLRYPRVGLVFCDVVAEACDLKLGSVPTNVSQRSLLIEDLAHWQTCDGVNLGIGAGMAVRRSAARSISGFDPSLGSGSRFRSGNDLDFALRMLMSHYQIYRTNRVSIIHHGFRTHAQRRKLIRNNMFAVGAVCGKLIKCGIWPVLRYYLAVCYSMVLLPTITSLLRLHKPPVLGRCLGLTQGLIAGLSASVDRSRALFNQQASD